MKIPSPRLPGLRVVACLSAILLALPSASASSHPHANPISRVARLINRDLVEMDNRISWLTGKMNYLAEFSPSPLKEQIGWRCGMLDPQGPIPTVIIDLHSDYLLNEIFLVPAQVQPGDTLDLFPRGFTLEAALKADFSDARQIFSTGNASFPNPKGYPTRFEADGLPARYVRLSIEQGHHRGLHRVAALSEIFIFSDRQPVSLGATVTANQSIDIPSTWHPSYLTDGRTPLGIWQGGFWSASRGDCIDVAPDQQATDWIVELKHPASPSHVILYPYALPELSGPGVMPPKLRLEIASRADFSDARFLAETGPEDLPINLTTPVVLETPAGAPGRYLRIHSGRAWQLSNRYLQALGEIEVWANGENLSLGQPVQVRQGDLEHPTSELTDGSSNGLQILPIQSWLNQLVERSTVEAELLQIRPQRARILADTELNTTWGAAIAIGLTFLIPVAIVERRRLVSKNQLDQLRKRIASDLHDDIGSNLGSISLIARSAKRDLERLEGPEEIAHDLGEVEVIARESSLAMRDIVWLLERRQDTIGDLVQRMRETGARLLRDVEYSIICRSNKTAAKLTLDAKRHLFLFYKESLHNILKHSRATQVIVRLYDSRDQLVMEVRDNGVGLPLDSEGNPKGVAKLTDRARVLEGSLTVESTAGEGTTLRLSVKRGNLIASKVARHD